MMPFLERTFHEDVITPETYTDMYGRVLLLAWSFDSNAPQPAQPNVAATEEAQASLP